MYQYQFEGAWHDCDSEFYSGCHEKYRRVTYAAPQLPAVPEFPEFLPCPVLLEPGFRFGKGVPTSGMLGALKRRAEHQAELDAMSPEAKAEYDASIEKLKAVLMPNAAEQRLAAAVELIKQAAPHMLADESLKDPDGALCGKRRAVPDEHVRREVNVGGNTWVQCSKQAYEKHKADGKHVRELYERPQLPAVPDGWVMVPKQLTQEMRNAWDSAPYTDDDDEDMRGAYARMIAAAPKPE